MFSQVTIGEIFSDLAVTLCQGLSMPLYTNHDDILLFLPGNEKVSLKLHPTACLLKPRLPPPMLVWVLWDKYAKTGLDVQNIYWGECLWRTKGRGPEKVCGEHVGGEGRGGKKEDWLKSVLGCSAIVRKFWPGLWRVLTPELPVRRMGQYY